MDIDIKNNINFKANLVTAVKGRGKIMPLVREEFAKVTKDIPGDFYIGRVINDVYPAKDKVYALIYENMFVYVKGLNKIWDKNPKKHPTQNVKEVTGELVNIFKALKLTNNYVNKAYPLSYDYLLARMIGYLNSEVSNLAKIGGDFPLADTCAEASNAHGDIAKAFKDKINYERSKLIKRLWKFDSNFVVDGLIDGVPKLKDLMASGYTIRVQ